MDDHQIDTDNLDDFVDDNKTEKNTLHLNKALKNLGITAKMREANGYALLLTLVVSLFIISSTFFFVMFCFSYFSLFDSFILCSSFYIVFFSMLFLFF